MKKFSLITVLFLLFLKPLFAVTYSSDPQVFITELVNDAITKLGDKNIGKEEKKEFIEKVALENVDINALGLYTLGEIRKSTNKDKLIEYQKSFEKYFLKSLTSRLSDYSENKFEVLAADKKSVNYTIVKSRVLKSDNQPEIKIDWRVYTKNPDKPLIRDLIVEV